MDYYVSKLERNPNIQILQTTISLIWKQIPNPHFKFYGLLYPETGSKIQNLKS